MLCGKPWHLCLPEPLHQLLVQQLTITTLPRGGAAPVSAAVTITGPKAGADVAQLYVTDPPGAGEPRQLEGFARVNLQPGASQTVSFPLTQRSLSYWNSGSYAISVGNSDAHDGTGAQVWQPQSGGALLNPQSGKCLDDTGWSTTPGTRVQIWSCTGAANQSWVQP
jgi:Fibronectin type III-like domain/Ricin-type beta-trefoil lectin domain